MSGPRNVAINSTSLRSARLRWEMGTVSVLHSHWSRNVEAWLSLVERIIVLLRQDSLWHKRAGASNSSEVPSTSRWTTLLPSQRLYKVRAAEPSAKVSLGNTIYKGHEAGELFLPIPV